MRLSTLAFYIKRFLSIFQAHQASSSIKRVKASRALRLIQVERSNALINFSVLYQAFFKRFSSVLCFATSKRQALVYFLMLLVSVGNLQVN